MEHGSGPALVAVAEDPVVLGEVERELRDRYDRHYRVMCMRSGEEALAGLEELAESRDEVALVLTARLGSHMTVTELADAARRLHPDARRGLLITWDEWGNPAEGEAVFSSMARGHIDHYVLRPATCPDEQFHQAISSLLREWTEARGIHPYTVHVVGESWSGRAYELRDVLGRCALPHSFSLADSEAGRTVTASAGASADDALPLVVFPNGEFLANPSNAEIAIAAGSPPNLDGMDFDLVIVGAGPAGLSAAVYGASEGLSTLVVDQGGIGGQATSSSLIRNYLGFPRGLSGRRLAEDAYDQAWVFGANFLFMHAVTDIARDDGELVLGLSDGGCVRARAVVLAMGATYRRLEIPELEALNGAGVFYGGSTYDAASMAGRDVYVLGGANSAGQAALHLARYARSVTLVVRADSLEKGMSDYLMRQMAATPAIEVRLETEIVGGGGEGWLEHLLLRDRASGGEETVQAGGLFLMIGASPKTDWLPEEILCDADGFVLTGPDLGDDCAWAPERKRLLFETGMPGVLAAGDVRHGSAKRVASAVGEGSVAIQLLHRLTAAEPRQRRGQAKESVPSAR